MPKEKRMERRLTLHIPAEADELAETIKELRSQKLGFAPRLADVWREALILGLRAMHEQEQGRGPVRRK